MTAKSEWISPYTWDEILEKFPLDYSQGRPVGKLPEGRILRMMSDKAGQYGDLLQYGNTYVSGFGLASGTSTVLFTAGYTASGTSFTLAATSSGTSYHGLVGG